MAYSLSFRCVKAPYMPANVFLENFGYSMTAINNALSDTHKTEEYHRRKRGENMDIVTGTTGKGGKYVWCRWGSDICAVSEDPEFINKIRFELRENYVVQEQVRLKPGAVKLGATVAQLLTELGADEYKPGKAKEGAEQLALMQ